VETLLKDYDKVSPTALEDLLLTMAKNVESSMIQAGATPGKDYTVLDLYKLVQPFALEVFKKGDADWTTSWPSV